MGALRLADLAADARAIRRVQKQVNRWLAALIAIIGGGAVAFGVILVATTAVAGILWLYVFGDDPWPPSVMGVLDMAIPLVGLALWALFAWLIWSRLTGPRRAG